MSDTANKVPLSWSGFFLIQPIVLACSYLVGCLYDAVFKTFGGESGSFPVNKPVLLFVVPATLWASWSLYMLEKRLVGRARLLIWLFIGVPIITGVIVQIVLGLIFSQMFAHPPG